MLLLSSVMLQKAAVGYNYPDDVVAFCQDMCRNQGNFKNVCNKLDRLLANYDYTERCLPYSKADLQEEANNCWRRYARYRLMTFWQQLWKVKSQARDECEQACHNMDDFLRGLMDRVTFAKRLSSKVIDCSAKAASFFIESLKKIT